MNVRIVGGGPVGAMLAITVARQGHEVVLYERRPDGGRHTSLEGRSINLALSERGWRALARVGVDAAVRRCALPMSGRAIHPEGGGERRIPYGRDGQAIWSASRADLNTILVAAAGREPGVRVEFGVRCAGIDLVGRRLLLERHDDRTAVSYDVLFGADGAGSTVRAELERQGVLTATCEVLDHGYLELSIPAARGGISPFSPDALHIWPRRRHMLIALPNIDGSMTSTVFLPVEGERSVARLHETGAARQFFAAEFPDALEAMPSFDAEFSPHRVGPLVTVRASPWTDRVSVCLVGDAAHAIVPFYGQGLNAGFEDCTVLAELLADTSLADALALFNRRRRPDTNAIADLALENFVEMRDRVADPAFVWRKRVEARIASACPDDFTPLYSLIAFGVMPYAQARERGRAQERVIDRVLLIPRLAERLDDPALDDEIRAVLAATLGGSTQEPEAREV